MKEKVTMTVSDSVQKPATIRIFGTAPDSIVDGPGLRFAVFVQGCSHGCPGCHNPESQPHEGGEVRSIDSLVAEVAANKLASGVTLSGGEPFEQATACAEVARRCRALGLGVWTYSGYTYEQLEAGVPDASARELLDATDVLVDGPFVQSLHSFDLAWRGSSNQRLVDVAATRAAGRVVEWSVPVEVPLKPPSW